LKIIQILLFTPPLSRDNGIFLLSSVFKELKGFKEIPIMEDYGFSKKINKKYKVKKNS
jgi:hypothetical protein